MNVILYLETARGAILFARFWDFQACGLVLELISAAGVGGVCVTGIAL